MDDSAFNRILTTCAASKWANMWKIVYLRRLIDATLNIAVVWNFDEEVEIKEFINIQRRRWLQRQRRTRRKFIDILWADKPVYCKWERYNEFLFMDIFRLRRLFDMEPIRPPPRALRVRRIG